MAKPCEHEWRMGHVSHGCTPGVMFADYCCVRCGARELRRVGSEQMARGWADHLERLSLELAYRAS